MAYGFRPVFWANFYVVWFVCDCVMVKDYFYGVSGLSETEQCVLGWQNCDTPKPGVPLTTCQPAEYSWMPGNPTPLMEIGQSLLCTRNSTQGTNLSQQVYNDHTWSICE